MEAFSTPAVTAGYAARTASLVPGLRDLHKLSGLLLAERAAASSRILVVGAGGGLELKALAGMYPDWRFTGVDPSAEMLARAREELGPLISRVTLLQGYIEDVTENGFDGAICLLTLHFLERRERLETLKEIRRRMNAGAAFVAAHHSLPEDASARARWLGRYAAFSAASGVPEDQAARGSAAIGERLPVLSPEEDAALLTEAGFAGVEQFYCAFTFRGWVGYAP